MIRLRTLGPVGLSRSDGSDITSVLSQPKRLALLVYLAVANGGAMCRRDTVLDIFWPEFDQERARAALRKALHFLRHELGDGVIVTRGDEEVGVDPDRLRCDVKDFDAASARGDEQQALDHYKGEFLDGFHLSDAAEFERWVDSIRPARHATAIHLARGETEELQSRGDLTPAARWAATWARLAPEDETAGQALITLLHKTGDRSGALRAYRSLRAALIALELEPGAETEALIARVREAPAGPSRAARTSSQAGMGPTAPTVERLPAPERKRRVVIGVAAITTMAGLLFVGLRWWRALEVDNWARWQAFSEIEALVEDGDFETAHRLATRASGVRPQDSALIRLWRSFTWVKRVTSQPEGARVYRRDYFDTLTTGALLGVTPLDSVRIPRGASRLRFEKDGFETMKHVAWWDNEPRDIHVRLDSVGQVPKGMVRVQGGRTRYNGTALTIPDFFVDRYEVTNAQYQRFVDAGGYSRPEFWDHPFVDGTDTLTWAEGVARLVDATGRPGPATWEAGTFPDGQDQHPVAGISWYEASAFARFTGKDLLTGHHWFRAFERVLRAWVIAASNVAGSGPAPVGSYPGMTTYGAYDMAGNVREWLLDGRDDRRFAAGASWQDPQWVAQHGGLPPAFDRSPTNGVRLARYPAREYDSALTIARSPVQQPGPEPDHEALTRPVTEELFAAFRRFFDYPDTPLRATIERTDSTRRWRHQVVTFDAAYPNEKVTLHVFLPQSGRPPYQTVLYFPGGAAFLMDRFEQYTTIFYDFIVKSGRAFVFPVYRGTFHRRLPAPLRNGGNIPFLVRDVLRSIEYLDTRADIDASRLAYYAYSGGVTHAPTFLGVTDRFKAAVLYIGGWWPELGNLPPEVSPLTYMHRVKVPILLFSGRYDYAFPPETEVTPWLPYLGTAKEDMRHVIGEGGHFIPRPRYIEETLNWLDLYLGPVQTTTSGGSQP